MAKSSTSVIHFETQRDNKTRWVKQAQLEGGDLGAANMGVAYSIMMTAHGQMSAADQASDYWEAQSDDGAE